MRITSLNWRSGDKKIEGAEEKSSALLLLKESIEFIEILHEVIVVLTDYKDIALHCF